ncbi:MAG: hypothetical protein WCC14_19845, partial [Acidobacteriaceae bacterium]
LPDVVETRPEEEMGGAAMREAAAGRRRGLLSLWHHPSLFFWTFTYSSLSRNFDESREPVESRLGP